MINQGRYYQIFLAVIIAALAYGSYQVLGSFARPLAWGGVLATVFYPLYAYLCRYLKWTSVASGVTVIIILMIILGPISWIAIMIVGEAGSIASGGVSMPDFSAFTGDPNVAWVIDKLGPLLNIQPDDVPYILRKGLTNFGASMIERLQKGTQNIVLAAVDFLMMLVATFFLLQDGSKFMQWLGRHLPFDIDQRLRLAKMVKDIVVSTIYGGIAVALVQAMIAGVTFYLLEVNSAGLLGIAVGFTSFVPMVGTALIWVPVALFLLVEGAVTKAVILTAVGVLGIGMADNILRPMIIGSRVKMHTLLIFFGVLGGINVFGLLGLIAGPVCIALFVAVIEMYKEVADAK